MRIIILFSVCNHFILLHVPNGEINFDLTYLRAPEELGNRIADLSFSEKRKFLFQFVSKENVSEKS